MQVTVERASSVLVDYLSAELEKVTDPVRRWGYRFAVGAMSVNPASIRQRASALGILDAEGMVDTDAVRNGLRNAFSGGNTLFALGMTFSLADGDEILRRLEQ